MFPSDQRSCVQLYGHHRHLSSHPASLCSGPQSRGCACIGSNSGCQRSRGMCFRPLTRLSSGAAVLTLRRRLATAAAAQATAQPTAHATTSESAPMLDVLEPKTPANRYNGWYDHPPYCLRLGGNHRLPAICRHWRGAGGGCHRMAPAAPCHASVARSAGPVRPRG